MADEKRSSEKSIEMRLAEIEDKLAKLHVTEAEIAAYNKISAMMGGAGGGAGVEAVGDPTAQGPAIPVPSPVLQCIVPRQISRYINRGIPRINRGIGECNECSCGPCGGFSGGGGGGFGGFGQ
jgi:hypothetical protein